MLLALENHIFKEWPITEIFYRKRIGSSGYVTRGCMPALLLTYQDTSLSLSPLQLLIGTVTGCYLDASGLAMHPDGTVQMETCGARDLIMIGITTLRGV